MESEIDYADMESAMQFLRVLAQHADVKCDCPVCHLLLREIGRTQTDRRNAEIEEAERQERIRNETLRKDIE